MVWSKYNNKCHKTHYEWEKLKKYSNKWWYCSVTFKFDYHRTRMPNLKHTGAKIAEKLEVEIEQASQILTIEKIDIEVEWMSQKRKIRNISVKSEISALESSYSHTTSIVTNRNKPQWQNQYPLSVTTVTMVTMVTAAILDFEDGLFTVLKQVL